MPKRKRDVPLDALIPRLRTDIFHALKVAKGFERQRQSKRLADPKTPSEKKARIENEVVVLKSLDLHHTAHAHLCTSLLKIKAIAEHSDRLPEEIRAGVPKPDLTEEERVALHNVTSSLYNRKHVKQAVEEAIEAVCKAIGVPVPEKKGKGKKGKEEKTENNTDGSKAKSAADMKEKGKNGKAENTEDKANGNKANGAVKKEKKKAEQAREGESREERGKRSERAEKKKDQKNADGVNQADDSDVDEEEEEKAVSQMDKMLGLDSSEESDDEEEDVLVKGQTRKPSAKELDPMEITTDEDGSDEEEDLDPMEVTSDDSESGSSSSSSEDDFNGFSDDADGQQSSASDDESVSEAESSTSSESRSPPPKKAKSAKGSLRPTDSTFLPTLMGGYISGSESASDVDVAPKRKNRRGQRARQAIWEKKYGDKARHLQKAAQGRDAGWDPKRGAVDGESKPWKRGIRNPLLEKDKAKTPGANETKSTDEKKQPQNEKKQQKDEKKQPGTEKKKPAERKRDDTGPLHPSWEAKRKAKEKQQLSAPFQGKKIVFD
ncbi:hypothetical protein VTH82DRAFT_8656 [Thermothelomyces myriococcoides]